MLFLARRLAPTTNVYQPFRESISSLKWLNYNARFIDPLFLNRIPKQRWVEIAQEVQRQLTDEVITKAFSHWPKTLYELNGQKIKNKLIKRRDQLTKVAHTFYEQVNKKAKVLGSEDKDIFELTYLNNKQVKLSIRRKKDQVAPYFYRTYDAKFTKELRIYALDGEDHLIVDGQPHNAIKIKFVGGPDKDLVQAKKHTQLIETVVTARSIAVYDRPKGLTIDPSIRVNDKRSRSAYKNQHDLHDIHHEPTTYSFLPEFSSNPDDDLFLGANLTLTFSGFKRKPFASSHNIAASVATLTLGAKLDYTGLWPETIGRFDQQLQLHATTPSYTRNFFGLSNTFIDASRPSRQFYQVRQGQLSAGYGLIQRGYEDSFKYGLKVMGLLIDTEPTRDRFVVLSPDVEPKTLTDRYFLGFEAFTSIDTRDNKIYPKQGLVAKISATIKTDVSKNDPDGTSGLLQTTIGTHIPFDTSRRLVLSSKIRAAGIIGNYPFYFAPTIGDTELRAYNAEQLAGDGVFVHSSDLRLELFRLRHTLPGAIGIAASFDHGLAFGPNTAAGPHHAMIGATAFWSILNLLGMQISYYHGLQEGQRLTFGLGSLFGQIEQGDSL